MKKFFQRFCLLLLLSTLTGCFSWIRAYQTYLQMNDFDKNFSFSVENQFSVHFKAPLLFSKDFVSLSKLQPSKKTVTQSGKSWRYVFRKIDDQNRVIQPEVMFYFDLNFDKNDKLEQWVFSPLFLEIAPAAFLEASLRSIAGADINTGRRQLKANFEFFDKVAAELPEKEHVLSQIGEPLRIKNKKNHEKYRYHFQLETAKIEKGYEERGLSVIKLTFDKATSQLIKMSGRFAGLKISIDYRKYRENNPQQLAQGLE